MLVAGSPCLAGARGQGERSREGELRVGDPAPDFELARLDGQGKVKLSAFKGDRPVVLIFGSYT
jgi:peroxiredoxin